MVNHTAGYYSMELQSFQELNEGYQLLPTIFNKVLDAVVRNWVSLVLGDAEEPYGMVKEVLYSAIFFYV